MIRLEIKAGLNIPLGEAPTESVEIAPPTVALLGGDFPGVRPELAVEVGDRVKQGDVLFVDRARPEIRFTAPAGGRVREIHRGARRSLEAIVIAVDGDASTNGKDAAVLKACPPDDAPPESVRAALLEAGLWPALRTRPFDRVPAPDAQLKELYVTAMDSNPLAPDPAPAILARAAQFTEGLRRLAGLADSCYVCMAAGTALHCPDVAGLVPVEVAGPHPAGLPGTHIYEIARVQQRRPALEGIWHVGYQDVIAIGELFQSGRLESSRTVTVAGPGAATPSRVTTTLGAELAALTGGADAAVRVISGSVLAGRSATRTTAYLGRYHNQVVVLPATGQTAAADAHDAGMLSLEAFERVWPFKVPPLPLLRALLIEDTETVSDLGCTLLAQEDVALCAYVCPARLDYGAALDRTLDEIRRGR